MVHLGKKRLVLRKDLAELDKLTAWIEASTREGISPNLSFNIQLCLEEAVANAIMYGAASDDQMEIAVELEGNGGAVVALIEDTGRPFDPTQAPPPARANSLAEAEVGNVGIRLMRSFANVMHYERRDGRNRLTLQFVESRAASHQPG
jgi:anti-sigma regulatory factor (Ser/Thr protein kinase)